MTLCESASRFDTDPRRNPLFRWARPAKSLINIQRRFALGLAEILSKHIAEQRTLFDGVVEGDVGMRMRVEPMFGHSAFSAFAIVLFQQGHGVGFDIEGGEAEGAFQGLGSRTFGILARGVTKE